MVIMTKRAKVILTVSGILLVLIGGIYVRHQYKYPYGWSHTCVTHMYMALSIYADDNGGFFPAGEATPEASLSLLYRGNYSDAYMLSGKSVSEETARKNLESGKLLGPESCGWHYVEGLHEKDSGFAILWDKTGLGHHGELSSGYRVLMDGGLIEIIPKEQMDNFIAKQQELLQAGVRKNKSVTLDVQN